jgi:ubiquinone/menaquinone biosynthesis C-methylase UbiE
MSQIPTNSREWDAAEYHRLSTPQFQWGQRVLGELHLRGDECVLDAGCGTGRLTELLLRNLPRGGVVGLDLSQNMVVHARSSLKEEFKERVEFVVADLVALPFLDAFDGIFSTASFHWSAIMTRCFVTSTRRCVREAGCMLNAEAGPTSPDCGNAYERFLKRKSSHAGSATLLSLGFSLMQKARNPG